MGIDLQPILPVTVPVKKIKGAARQRYGDSDGIGLGVNWPESEVVDPEKSRSHCVIPSAIFYRN